VDASERPHEVAVRARAIIAALHATRGS
jgi:hypothetical protein